MVLEPAEISSVSDRTEYTCPMHPEIVRDQPGNCPICGMALELRDVSVDAANPELANMTRRFWVAVALTVPLLAVMVSDVLPGHPLQHLLTGQWLAWLEFVLATPVVLWAGWPFFERGWASIVHRSPNMFTPGIFPRTFRDRSGAKHPGVTTANCWLGFPE
jgi:Cu+-exporting ATPase